ncbi:MAG: high frequency lysogenization protein HflD [Candidatus Solibacter sp.]
MGTQAEYLSHLLHQGDLGWNVMLAGLLAAFLFGAVHALSPGHGKTLVAAYLVGSRGTPRHAVMLGLMVTFTHTVSVFALGLVTLYLSRFVLPETLTPILGAISGLTIVWVGLTLLYRRTIGRRAVAAHGPLMHSHGDGRVHSHVPEEISVGGLIALGASGGLVPCPSALVLLLTAVSLGRVSLGLTLLVAFSAGLAVVLTGIGLAVLFARNLLPDSATLSRSKAMRYLPAASAAFIVCVGVAMTWVSLAGR